MKKSLQGCLLVAICSLSLQGCFDVATTGAQAIYQRHTIQKNVKDQYITMQAMHTMSNRSREFRDTNISIATYNREVLLTGQVPYAVQKRDLEKIVRDIDGVEKIYNLVDVQPVASVLTRANDTWITTKIKTKLMTSNDVDGSQVKVITENGTVYLMGVLQPEAAEAAADIASRTDGVSKVIKIFSYMKISKHPEA